MKKIQNFGTHVSVSANNVFQTADAMAISMQQVNDTMEEVANGVQRQVQDTGLNWIWKVR